MGKLAIGERRPYVDLNSKAAERMSRNAQAVVSLVVGGFLLFWPSTSVRTHSWSLAAGRSLPGLATSWPLAGQTWRTPTVFS
jgi:uncharacterized membrane protein HdeD (DUF308 family)